MGLVCTIFAGFIQYTTACFRGVAGTVCARDGGPSTVARALVALQITAGCFFFCLVTASYVRTMFADPGTVPEWWRAKAAAAAAAYAEAQALARDPEAGPAEGRGDSTGAGGEEGERLLEIPGPPPRYCARCGHHKPPRCHHDSVTNMCVLKFDHFCPWVGNAVGYGNYKYFCNFIAWTMMGALFVAASLAPLLKGAFTSGPSGSSYTPSALEGAAALLAASFGFSLTCFCVMHGYLLLEGVTTLELHTRERFSRGAYNNVVSVLGSNPWLWLVPVRADTMHAGVNWDLDDEAGGDDSEIAPEGVAK